MPTAKQDLDRQIEALVDAGVARERIYVDGSIAADSWPSPWRRSAAPIALTPADRTSTRSWRRRSASALMAWDEHAVAAVLTLIVLSSDDGSGGATVCGLSENSQTVARVN